MRRGLIQLDMAFETLLGAGAHRLRLGRRQPDLMNVMTGGTGDPFGHMLGLHPVSVLLVMALAEVFRIVLYNVAFGIGFGYVVGFKGPAGAYPTGQAASSTLVEAPRLWHEPQICAATPRVNLARLTMVCRFSNTAVLGRAACHEPLPWQDSQPTTGSTNVRFSKSDTGGVEAAALENPVALIPVGFVVRRPAVGLDVVLNRRDKETDVLFDDVALFPLAADGVAEIFRLGDENLIDRHFKLAAKIRQTLPNFVRIKVDDNRVEVVLGILGAFGCAGSFSMNHSAPSDA